MAHCPQIEECLFFQEEIYLKTTHLVQDFQFYSQDKYVDCALYVISSSLGEQYVPPLMLPSKIEWAQEILKENMHTLPIRESI